MPISTPGYKDYHNDDGLNYMLNRMAWVVPTDELYEVASKISTLEDWVVQMLEAAQMAEATKRYDVSAKFYQAAEFYMEPGAPGKLSAYKKFIRLHDQAHPDTKSIRTSVPYLHGSLPVFDIPATGKERGTILAHSGFDGLVEEMYPTLLPLAAAGHRVLAFEGPGQGGALRNHKLTMTQDWHLPVAAILDHFNVETCTLIGLSLGGCLAPRAAAFEPRVKRVVSWGAMYDFFDSFKKRMGSSKLKVLRRLALLGIAPMINAAVSKAGESDATMRWGTNHGLQVSGCSSPYEFFHWSMSINLRDVAEKINQDVLIIMGSDDHIVPQEQFFEQAKAMTAARSVSTRLITSHEGGEQHCQVGNPFLAVDEICRWLEGLDRRDAGLS